MTQKHSKNNSLQIRQDDLVEYHPITDNQGKVWSAWNDNYNLVLTGSAGTGKTFMGMYQGMKAVLNPDTPYDRLVIVRSMVATRDMGFLPGTKQEKEDAFLSPYKAIAHELFNDPGSWGKAVSTKKIEFTSTSYIRGLTLDNCIVLVDEMQNLNFHELDSITTRMGRDSRMIFAGDYRQSDFTYDDDRQGIIKFLTIVEQLKKFEVVNFGWEDIVRSDFVRDYIMTKEMLGY